VSDTLSLSPHHLTVEQLADFDRDGYLVLRGRIPAGLLARLQDAADDWIEQGRRLGDGGEGAQDFHWATRPSGRVPFRVNYIHDKGRTESLELLGSPELLGIAESLAGPDFVPTYESLVFKHAGDGAPIPWHQDALHPRSRRITNIDVYLDDSIAGQGALRVLPGSQAQKVDVCAVRDQYGWEPPGFVEVELEAGDVLLHDVMVVHGSPPTTGNALRRTLYYEFRSAQQIRDEGPFDEAWVERRMRLMAPALAAHAAAFPDAVPFDWRPSPELRPEPLGDTETELKVAHAVWNPGSFCSAGDSKGAVAPATR
jgi:ectoine hydroxylase-related dioxygenase (phytanoyl-CoA dioxygenase family)